MENSANNKQSEKMPADEDEEKEVKEEDNVVKANKKKNKEKEKWKMDIVRCICGNTHKKNIICCDICNEWQHMPCVGASEDMETYYCDRCRPLEFWERTNV